ncbi:MAG: hypothetical protein LBL47_00315, partial [Lactobacillus sp.]|nr:hypothetical protein [Lactobacillus sp.]
MTNLLRGFLVLVFSLTIHVSTVDAGVVFLGGDDTNEFGGYFDNKFIGDDTCDRSLYPVKCEDPYVGIGASCGRYAQSCGCPQKYRETCSGTGLEPATVDCDGKYADCQCNSNYQEVCDYPYTGVGTGCVWDSTTLYGSCKCQSQFSETCTGDYEGVGDKCNQNGADYYESCKCSYENKTCSANENCTEYKCDGTACNKCECKSEFQYTAENCKGDYTPTGGTCDGKYSTCSCRFDNVSCGSGETCSSTACDGKVCTACKCRDDLNYTTSNCNGDYTPTG